MSSSYNENFDNIARYINKKKIVKSTDTEQSPNLFFYGNSYPKLNYYSAQGKYVNGSNINDSSSDESLLSPTITYDKYTINDSNMSESDDSIYNTPTEKKSCNCTSKILTGGSLSRKCNGGSSQWLDDTIKEFIVISLLGIITILIVDLFVTNKN